jgi:hypothetical protein
MKYLSQLAYKEKRFILSHRVILGTKPLMCGALGDTIQTIAPMHHDLHFISCLGGTNAMYLLIHLGKYHA